MKIAFTLLSFALLLCSIGAARPAHDKRWPDGSERAIKAVLALEPGAAVDEVTAGKDLGLPGADMALWTIKLRGGSQLDVAGDGVLVHRSKPVQEIDLPTLVGNGKAKIAPSGTSKIVKLETLAVVKLVALPAPQVRYVVRANSKSVTVSADGTSVSRVDGQPTKAPKVDPQARTTDGPIPELASKAVRAMRDIFPDMVFDLVEEVPYVDGTTQTVEMLWYEVEFFVGGVKHEFDASPDGVVMEYRKTIPIDELPNAAASAVAKEVPGWKIEDVAKLETRAMPKFVALERPIICYDITPHDQTAATKLRMDGTEKLKRTQLKNNELRPLFFARLRWRDSIRERRQAQHFSEV